MWLVVYFPDSNDYCVLKRNQVTEGEVAVGSFVKVVYNAKVLFANPSKAVCDKECESILKKLPQPEDTATHSPIPRAANESLSDSKLDQILSHVSRIDSCIREISSRQLEMQQDVDSIKAKVERLEQSERSLRSSVYELLDRVPPRSDVPKGIILVFITDSLLNVTKSDNLALTYPYSLSKERVDDIYQMKRTATAFARAVERELFAHDVDRNVNLDKRRAQDKVRWLRDLVRYRYPTSTPTAEASIWSSCQIAINDYHRKKRRRDGPSSESSRETRSHNIFYPENYEPSTKRAHVFEVSSDLDLESSNHSNSDLYQFTSDSSPNHKKF
ncbi:hypothetical protein Y032_0146g2531 [Ancylostoma ceylanicum]|nr:hypothetical protein Y032_0146g2531 [Ancylostoma ceylanicum]